jgi:hypothetical protein
MKNKTLINLIAMIFFGMLALTVFAEDKAKAEKKAIDDKDEIVLQDGKVLKKPYIISRTPTGLNVGHESGVIFIPFSEMSEKRQKQYNYNPEKAKAYKKRIAQAQQRRKERIVQANQKNLITAFSLTKRKAFPNNPPELSWKTSWLRCSRDKLNLKGNTPRLARDGLPLKAGIAMVLIFPIAEERSTARRERAILKKKLKISWIKEGA